MSVPDRSQVPTKAPEAATLDVLEMNPGADPGEAYLVVHLGGLPRLVLLPDGVEVTIGRARSSTVFVDDERASRRHARIWRRGPDVFAGDLGSRNGTFVGGARLTSDVRVQGGDVIEVGPVRAVVAVATHVSRASPPASGDGPPTPVGIGRPGARAADEGAPREPTDRGEVQVIADPLMLEVYERCRRVAPTPLSVLITGETGVGKERIAEAILRASARAEKPFVRLHVGALPESLVESELFGHERGAFTGADRRHRGYFEAASGGTILLDEIGELPLPIQAKLLRVLESNKVCRVGSTEELDVDARVLAATNRDLAQEVRAGRFREDLFFRLSAFRIEIPPLRRRPSEIALLASLFARDVARAAGRPAVVIKPAALAALERYGWPGNIRELKHVVEAAVIMAGDQIDLEHLPPAVLDLHPVTEARPPAAVAAASGAPASLGASVEQLERDAIVAALKSCDGNQTHAAEKLGLSRRTLIYKMKRLAIRSARVIE